ncbi:MAG: chromosome segregation protein SMC [Candidatus Thermoplasmatota archaeon]|nr:chromosome segregation protein SMC [Candidatus Thermoplasmatota archaeon]
MDRRDGMYLKELVMVDFKSFKGEVRIPFGRGFTAITGPNGSGKSNSGDAIQFVLGPKSAKTLRAQNSKDLIFNGGKNSRPAKGCAVTLVFANPAMEGGLRRLPLDMDEITMAKRVRLTPAGNVVTEYQLNGEESSLKAFHRLLGAANARPDGYNIVLQGDVTSLSKMSSGERRKVLDDVAGVTSYDEEIRKADRQRKQVEEYLERIAMIEQEQQRHLAELVEEKKDAEKALKIREDLLNARARLWRARLAGQQGAIEHQRREIGRNIEEASALEADVAEAAKHLIQLDDAIAELVKQIQDKLGGGGEALQQEIQRLNVAIETAADRLSDMASRDQTDGETRTRLEADLDEASAASDHAAADIKQAEEALKAAKDALAAAAKEEATVREALEGSTSDVAELARTVQACEEEIEHARAALANAQSDVDRSATAGELLLEERQKAEEALAGAKMQVAESELQGQEIKAMAEGSDRESLARDLTAAQRKESTLVEEANAVETRLRDVERQLARARAAMESNSGSSGLTGGAAAVLGARDSGELEGIFGTIAELCAPKDEAHSTALSTAIGGGMMSVVVETDEVAAKAIRWLKNNNAGRATFLPLNKINAGRPAGRAVMVARQPGVIGFAHDLLEHDPRINTAVRFVLRNTLVVDTMATARANMGGVRLITLDGSVAEAGGAMTGGSPRRSRISFGGKIQGASEVERLSKEVERLRMMSEGVSAKVREAREAQAEVRRRLGDLANNDAAAKLASWRSAHAAAKSVLAKEEGNLAGLVKRLDAFEQEGRRHLALRAQAQQRLTEAVEAKDEANQHLQDASPTHLKERLHAAELAKTTAEADLQSNEATIRSGKERHTLLFGNVEDLTGRLDALASDAATRATERATLERAMAENREVLTAKEEERRSHLEEHQGLEDERIRLVDERSALRAASEQKASDARSRRQHAEELRRLLSTSETHLVEIRASMVEEGVPETVEDEAPLPTVADGERTVRRLERRIEDIGSVNWRAIEQHAACEERLASLSADHGVLKGRRQDLLDLAEQLDQQRTVRLTQVLSKVNENFKRVYKTLSKGGEGELFLENPEQPFSGGLDMWARPRGKSSRCRLQGLSGGEQSMAALALIFAIQDYDPSPFYYFDEVDQNLDSDNARLIAEMCRARSERAQFIMVTLRKVSLSLADHHIGVTHGGDGCSRRIMDFNRQRALELGEAAEEAAAADAAKNADRAGEAVAFQNAMPEVPESLGTPKSLEGLMARADEMAEEESETREHLEAVREAADSASAEAEQDETVLVEVPDEE